MRAARAAIAIAALAGCGRIGFDGTAQTGGDGDAHGDGRGDAPGGGDGMPGDGTLAPDAFSTGVVGPRALTIFGASATGLHVTGVGGEAVAVIGFTGSLAFGTTTITGKSSFGSSAVVRFDTSQAVVSTTTLDATGFCETRDAEPFGSEVVTAGITSGGAGDASYGPCAVATGRQDPFAIAIDRAGTQTALIPFVSGSTNAQLFHAALLADGSYAVDGVYGDHLSLGSNALPAITEDSGFYARYLPATGALAWSNLTTSSNDPTNGPIAPIGSGADMCTSGRMSADTNTFGTQLADAGGNDVWVARVDGAGSATYVRQIGTPGTDNFTNPDNSLVALGGDCVGAFDISDDITIDGHALPVAAGPGTVLAFDATGALAYGFRTPVGGALLVTAGGKLYLAMTVSAPVAIGGTQYAPMGTDVIVVQVDPTGLVALAGVVGGAGNQQLASFAAIADDAVALGVFSTGAISFGSDGSDSGGTQVGALATLGVH